MADDSTSSARSSESQKKPKKRKEDSTESEKQESSTKSDSKDKKKNSDNAESEEVSKEDSEEKNKSASESQENTKKKKKKEESEKSESEEKPKAKKPTNKKNTKKDTKKDKAPAKKDVKLEELDVIFVENSQSGGSVNDEEESINPNDSDNESSKKKDKKTKRSVFELTPDETIANIFEYLSEEELVRTGLVCKRFYSLLNEDLVWESKAQSWKWVKLKDQDDIKDPSKKDYYVRKYRDNKKKEEDNQRQLEINEREQQRTQKKEKITNFMMKSYFRFHGMEIPVVVLKSIWTLLLALRADNYITCSYHVVFIPVYLALFHIFCCFVITDCINYYFDSTGQYHSWREKNLVSIFASEFRPFSRGTIMNYCTLFCYTAWMVCLAIGKDDHLSEDGGQFDIWWSLFPLFFAFFCYTIGWCTYEWYDSSDRLLWVVALLMPFCVFMWIVLFIMVKAEEAVTFSWWVSLVPWWIVGIIGVFPLGVAWIFIIFRIMSGSDRSVAIKICIPCTIALVSLATWFGLMAQNHEQYIRDLPTWPWTLVCVPLFFGEIGFICCLFYFAYLIW